MNQVDLTSGLEQAWISFITFIPKLLAAALTLLAGYFLAKLLFRLVRGLLERLGFDRLVERGGLSRVLKKTRYRASGFLARMLFYTFMLFVLQLAFGFFGPNPISAMLAALITFLPNVFAAVLIVVVASAIAAGLKDVLQAVMAGLSYGRLLANAAAVFIVATGVFAALNQINIAPAIVNGLFYAVLAIIAGSAIVAIGGGGIVPMRRQWEKLMSRIERESDPAARGQVADYAAERSETWKEEAEQSTQPKVDVRSFPQ